MKYIVICVAFCFFNQNIFSQQKTGCLSGDCRNGKGVYLFTNGDKYEGDFVDDHLVGFGKYIDSRGNIYTGYFKNDTFNGVGSFLRSDGTKYIGEFKDGRRSGLGTQWYSETYKEKGKWENDRFIDNAEFEDFIVEESYDFCKEFLKIFYSSVDNFSSVKGKKVSDFIEGSYYCTVKLKELSIVEINEKDGFMGTYFNGDKGEGLKKFEELNSLILSCNKSSCCSFQNKFTNGVKIQVLCKIQGNLASVMLQIPNH